MQTGVQNNSTLQNGTGAPDNNKQTQESIMSMTTRSKQPTGTSNLNRIDVPLESFKTIKTSMLFTNGIMSKIHEKFIRRQKLQRERLKSQIEERSISKSRSGGNREEDIGLPVSGAAVVGGGQNLNFTSME